MIRRTLFITVFLTFYHLLLAQTVIPDKSEVYGNWTAAQSPYLIEGEAIVPVDSTLHIEAGVEVRFKTGTEADYLNPAFDLAFLRVEGKLTAEGTADQPLLFTRNGENGNWGILYFHSSADSSSHLQYCRIEYASQVLHLNDWKEHTGAISLNETFLTLENCRILHNAYDGLFMDNATLRLWNCLIAGNRNGILSTNACDVQMINCTVANHSQTGYDAGYNATAEVVNSIFWANQQSIESNLTSTVNLSYSLLEENQPAEGVTNGSGNLLAIDPHFNNMAAGDYTLRSNSFCINGGTRDTSGLNLPTQDAGGQDRILDSRIDMGAFEFAGSYLRLTVPNGGESWKIGTKQTIRWQSNVSAVNLEYSADNGQNWQSVSVGQPGSGTYDWLIPDEQSEQCLFRVSDAPDPALTDQSDTTFIISDKTIISNGQRVSGIWSKAYSPYVLRGEALVPAESLLVIEPGVQVRFVTGSHHVYTSPDFDLGMLRVDGRLSAQGTAEDSIVFTRNGNNGYWGLLFFNENSLDSSLLAYVRVTYASYGDSLVDSLTLSGAVSLYGARLRLEHAELGSNLRQGIHVTGKSSPRILRCTIHANGSDGILFSNNQGKNNPLLYGNRIFANGGDGLSIQTPVYCQIENNRIYDNQRYGIYTASGYAQTKALNNRISGQEVGIYCNGLIEITGNLFNGNRRGILLDHLDPQIMNNTLVNHSEEAIYCNEASPYVTNCIFSNNTHDFDFASGDASNPYVTYSLFSKTYIPPKATDGGGNRKGYNPSFVQEGEDPFALMSNSPAIDAGTMDNPLVTLPENDLAGNPRVYDGNNDGQSIVDMGAYEFSQLIADFSADVLLGEKPLSVQFTNRSVGEIDSLVWYFGDGDSAYTENPRHIYTHDGSYPVRLRIFGKLGSSEKVRSDYVIVEQAPLVVHSPADTSVDEDSGQHFMLYFPQVFSDPDSADTLSFRARTGEAQALIRISGDSLFLNFSENYFGRMDVMITATDPYGLSASDTFFVTVNSLNDAPVFLDELPDTLRFKADSSVILETWRSVYDAETPAKQLSYLYTVSNDSIVLTELDSSYSITLSAEKNFHGQGWLYIDVRDDSLASASDSILIIVEEPLGMGQFIGKQPLEFDLLPNYPNPFGASRPFRGIPQTVIRYQLSTVSRVQLQIYNILGQKIQTLVRGVQVAGRHVVVWDASGYPSGVYIVRFSAGNGYTKSRKIVLLR